MPTAWGLPQYFFHIYVELHCMNLQMGGVGVWYLFISDNNICWYATCLDYDVPLFAVCITNVLVQAFSSLLPVFITTTTTVMAATVSTLHTDIKHLLWAVAVGEWATIFRVPSLQCFYPLSYHICSGLNSFTVLSLGGAVGWGTMLQAWRSRVRFPMVSLKFFIDIVCIMALGLTQPLTEMSTRNISWGVKAAGAEGWQLYYLHVPIVLKSGSLYLLEPSGPVQACNWIAFTFHCYVFW